MIKRLLLIAVVLLPGGVALAQEDEGDLMQSHTDINDIASLQRGARNFMNYCSGCHSLTYVRYNRIAQDLRIPEADLTKNLMFTSSKVADGVLSAMPTADAANWFGKPPPDLSLMARERGTNYLFSFLEGFYVDPARPWGVNNRYLPAAAMPAVLSSLQGTQQPVYEPDKADGHLVLTSLKPLAAGSMTQEEYDGFVRDTVNFLDYAGEPVKAKRQSLGVFVTLFLLAGFVFAYLLKKEYWKDVH
jgi:ubiquinol-cytochrome c reductase cytochrome c1 subunit